MAHQEKKVVPPPLRAWMIFSLSLAGMIMPRSVLGHAIKVEPYTGEAPYPASLAMLRICSHNALGAVSAGFAFASVRLGSVALPTPPS